jgi:uncharacterized protein DUF4382
MSVKSRTLTYGITAVAIAIIIVGGVVALNPSLFVPLGQSGSGSLNIYLTDAPPSSPTLKYLLINVSSLELRYSGYSETTTSSASTSTTTLSSSATFVQSESVYVYQVPSSVGTNVNLTRLHGTSILMGATKVPAGQIDSIVIHLTGAKAFFTDKTSEQLKVVANGRIMVPIAFSVIANGSTDLTIDITPNFVHLSQAGVLTPVIHATSVEQGPGNTATTHTAEVDYSTAQ